MNLSLSKLQFTVIDKSENLISRKKENKELNKIKEDGYLEAPLLMAKIVNKDCRHLPDQIQEINEISRLRTLLLTVQILISLWCYFTITY